MRPPIISFQQDPATAWLGHASGPVTRVLAMLACLLAAGLLGAMVVQWSNNRQALASQKAELAARHARLDRRKPSAPPAAIPPTVQEAQRHNLAVGQLNTPWSDIFDALERHVPGELGLTLLEPDPLKGTLRIQTEGKDVQALLAHAERLSTDPVFGRMNLLQHETNEQDPNKPARLSFELRLAARPGTATTTPATAASAASPAPGGKR